MFQAANYDFYVTQKNLCCRDLERIDFPVFQASIIDSHPARISPIPTPISNDVDEKIKDSNFTNSSSHGNTLSKPELSQGEFSYQIQKDLAYKSLPDLSETNTIRLVWDRCWIFI